MILVSVERNVYTSQNNMAYSETFLLPDVFLFYAFIYLSFKPNL